MFNGSYILLEAVYQHFEKIICNKCNTVLSEILFKEVDLNNSDYRIYSQFDSKNINDFKAFSLYD